MIAKIILIVLNILGLGLAMGKHGEKKEDWNAWISLIALVIVFTLYYYAGVFNFNTQ